MNIKEIREDLGLDQDEMADLLDVSFHNFCMLESGEMELNSEMKGRIENLQENLWKDWKPVFVGSANKIKE